MRLRLFGRVGDGFRFVQRSPRLLHVLGVGIGLGADFLVEALAVTGDSGRVFAAVARPVSRELVEGDGAFDLAVPGVEDAPLHHLACALGDGSLDLLAGVHEHMLQVREDTRLHIGKAFASYASAGGAEAGEVVLRRPHIAGTTAVALEGQVAGLNHHLKECIVPAHPELLAMPHVLDGDLLEACVFLLIAGAKEGHQPAGRGALRHRIAF